MRKSIVLLPGDGIGPLVVEEARAVLETIALCFDHDFHFDECLIGGAAIEREGKPLPDATLAACRASDAVLLGAVGGPRWADPSAAVRPEQGLLDLRRAMRVYANLRPIRVFPALQDISPIRPERLAGVDILVVRELCGGLYFGEPHFREGSGETARAVDTLVYTAPEIRRVVHLAFQLASKRRGLVTSIDKANVLESSRLWRQVANDVAREFPHVRLEHQLVDSAAMRLITNPRSFDVIVTENMFGDILTDEAAVLAGSLGLLPSASLGDGTTAGLYEPVHGSAPDLAGTSSANPIGAIASAALLLRYSLGLEHEASAIDRAIEDAIADGARTADMGTGQSLSTHQMGQAIRNRIMKQQASEDFTQYLQSGGRA